MKIILVFVAFVGVVASAYVAPGGYPGRPLGGYSHPAVDGFSAVGGYSSLNGKIFKPKIIAGYKSQAGAGYQIPLAGTYKSPISANAPVFAASVAPIVKSFHPKITGGYQSHDAVGYETPFAGGYHSPVSSVFAAPVSPILKTFQPKITGGYGSYSVNGYHSKFAGGYQSPLSVSAPVVPTPVVYSAGGLTGVGGLGSKRLHRGSSSGGFGYDLWKKKKAYLSKFQ